MHYINLFIHRLAIFSQVLVHDIICWRHGNIKLTWNPQDDSSLSQHICISTGNVLSKLMPHGNMVLLPFLIFYLFVYMQVNVCTSNLLLVSYSHKICRQNCTQLLVLLIVCDQYIYHIRNNPYLIWQKGPTNFDGAFIPK